MAKLIKIFVTTAIILAIASRGQAQKKFDLEVEIVCENGKSELEKAVKTDSSLIEKKIFNRLNQLYYEGYLTASVDEYLSEGSTIRCKISRGKLYSIKNLSPGNIDPAILGQAGYKRNPGALKPSWLEKLFNELLDYAENNGYPFAIVKLDSIRFYDDGITASLQWYKGPQIKFEPLEVESFNKLKLTWLENYLGIQNGQLYKESAVDAIESKLRDLTFVELNESPDVSFTSSSATVKLSLKEKKIDNIDGVIGLLPNQRDNSKMLIVGSFNLHLYNLFSSAKQLHIDWQKVNVLSQTLNTSLYFPQFLKMPLGISFDFNLLKEDTIYLNRYTIFNVDFVPTSRQKVFFSTTFENSTLLGQGSEIFEPGDSFNEYSINYLGLSYQFNSLDDNVLSTSGSFLKLGAFTGAKRFNYIYGSQDQVPDEIKATQYKLEALLTHHFRFSDDYQIKWKVRSGNLFGGDLFQNDLYRLGGLKSIRGFNENFFFSSNFIYSNLEFRIMRSRDTYFFLFYDQGVLNNKTNAFGIDYPFGTGLGLNFGTNAGLFSLVIGAGKSRSQIFSLNSAKIHFGYLGRF